VRGALAGQQPDGQLAGGAQPVLLLPGLVVQPGVLNGDTSRRAEGGQQGLVVLGELAATALLGQVEVAEDVVPDPHRDPEEAVHRRVARGESRRLGVAGDVGHPQRVRVLDEQAEQAAALRPVVDLGDLGGVEAYRDELGEPLVLANDAERAVPGIDELDGRLHDPAQRRLEVQPGPDRDDGLQQAAHPVPGRDDSLKPRLELPKQVIQSQLGEHSPRPGPSLHRAHRNGIAIST
jgi:hypothetical protein